MDALVVPSPAKVNLYLEVVARRADGYHEVRTFLHLIDLADRVTLHRRAHGVEVTATGREVPLGQANLAYRAAEVLRARAGRDLGVAIHLEKVIPLGSGLGGGSSNAAATLWGLNRLWGLGLPTPDLAALGADLGADVPFFLGSPAAFARGRGEVLEALPPLPRQTLVVAYPGVVISTAWAYGRLSLPLTLPGAGSNVLRFARAGDAAAVWRAAFNRLEEATLPGCPAAAKLKARLLALGVRGALLSGSGSAVFGVTADLGAGARIAARVRAEGIEAWVCQTLDANPITHAGCPTPASPGAARAEGHHRQPASDP